MDRIAGIEPARLQATPAEAVRESNPPTRLPPLHYQMRYPDIIILAPRSRDSVLSYHSSLPQPELIDKGFPSSVCVAGYVTVV